MRCMGEDDGCCTYSEPCEVGEGDCDVDGHCVGALICGSDNCPWGDRDDCCTHAGGRKVRSYVCYRQENE